MLKKTLFSLGTVFIWFSSIVVVVLSLSTAEAQDQKEVIIEKIGEFQSENSIALHVAWNPVNSSIAFARYDGTSHVSIRQTPSGSILHELDIEKPGIIVDLQWSPDGTRLALAYEYSFIEIWQITEAEFTNFATLVHEGWVRSVSWDPKSQYLLSSSGSSTQDEEFEEVRSVNIWDVDNPNDDVKHMSDNTERITLARWAPTGDYIATVTWEDEIQLRETENFSIVASIDLSDLGTIQNIVWQSTGDQLAVSSCSSTCTVSIIDVSVPEVVYTVDDIHDRLVMDLNWHPFLDVLVSGGDFDKMAKLTRIADDSTTTIGVIDDFSTSVTSVSWSHTGDALAIGEFNGRVTFWSVKFQDSIE